MERETVIKILRQLEPELRQLGVVHASLFGSLARQEATEGSDIDIAVQLSPELRGFYAFGALERVKQRLEHQFHSEVDVIPEPIQGPLKAPFESDRCVAF